MLCLQLKFSEQSRHLLALAGWEVDEWPVGGVPHLGLDVLLQTLKAPVVVGLVGLLVPNLGPVLQGLLDNTGRQVQRHLSGKNRLVKIVFQSE